MQDQTPNPTRYPLMPTCKKHARNWLSSISLNRDTVVDPDRYVPAGLQPLEFRFLELSLPPGAVVRVFFRGIDNLYCITREDALAEDQYWVDLELARIAAVKAEIRRRKAEVKAFNISVNLPVDWTVVRRNVQAKGGVATHILLLSDINSARAKRSANSLLCGTKIGTTGVAHMGAFSEITCVECLTFIARGNRRRTDTD